MRTVVDLETDLNTVTLAAPDDFDGWRAAVRGLVQAAVVPADVTWQIEGECGDLLAGAAAPGPTSAAFKVPKAFIDLARRVICHADPERFALLHDLLARMRTEPELFNDAADALVHRITRMDQSIRRDVHKMRAFVRFREFPDPEVGGKGERFAAWFEPEHHIVRLNAPFFVRRFTAMHWSILTPEVCAHWDTDDLSFTAGTVRSEAPGVDPLEATWTTYYASIFNPARLKVKAMTTEMPKKYWKNLPEAALVPGLIAGATARMTTMLDDSSNAPTTLDALRAEASACTRCPLYAPATQTVFGEGPADAALMFVGEQPGDQEDLAGHPFVGPAGQMFNRALADAGVDRARSYVTNAVKHFKFVPRGKRRIHEKPNTSEIVACNFWLELERKELRPVLTVMMGATAVRAVLGRAVPITRERGKAIALDGNNQGFITVHPSYLLRLPDEESKAREWTLFVQDLRTIAALAA